MKPVRSSRMMTAAAEVFVSTNSTTYTYVHTYVYLYLYMFLGEWLTKNIVDDEGPLPAISVGGETERDGADSSKHENKGDTPGNVRLRPVKILGKRRDRQRDGEEIEGIPSSIVVSPRS
jgi:hypothetical protein